MNIPQRGWLPAALAVAGFVAMCLVPPIPQDPAYHAFADGRALLGIPNFWNVVSNAGYLFAGIYGLANLRRLRSARLRPACITFCVAAMLVAAGSSWYHVAPTSASLVWDRLPMTAGFMALLCLVLGEHVSWRLAQRLLWPLVVAGVASVLYWAWTEQHGAGDLRPYALVQFLPVLLMPLILLLFPVRSGSSRWLWLTFAAYAIAKVAEHFDARIHAAIGFSGHSIKHVVSSVAVLCAILAMYRMGQALDSSDGRD